MPALESTMINLLIRYVYKQLNRNGFSALIGPAPFVILGILGPHGSSPFVILDFRIVILLLLVVQVVQG